MTKFKTFYNLFSLQRRFLCIVLAIIMCFVALNMRLFHVQIFQNKELQVKAMSQWLRDLPLAARRGDITDCNGVLLATSVTTYDVYVRARNVEKPNELANLLSIKLNKDYDLMYTKVTNKNISESLIKMQVDKETAYDLIDSGLKGLCLSQNVGRIYPFGDMLTQTLGFTTIDNVGQAGIEAYYDKYLKGVEGKSLVQANAQGKDLENSIEYYIPSIPGLDVNITIDAQIQSILEQALNEAYTKHSAKAVTGIILDAETGGILAMSNKPSFDLNAPPRDNVAILNTLTKNSCVVDVYEPGSTFKIFTLSTALNEGLVSLDDRFFCGGSCTVDGQKIKCWKTIGHGSQNLIEGFKNSCNCVFVNLALRIGKEKFYQYLEDFGLGSKTGVDIFAESSGILTDVSQVTNNDLARIGFGQSIAVSPLQMLASVSAAITGSYKTPHLLQSMCSHTDQKTCYSYNVEEDEVNISEDTRKTVLKMMSININGFEGKLTYIPGYDVGGKTGTAQKFANGIIAQGKYVSSFIGVYPTKSPKYLMLISVDEPKGAYYGGIVASPIGKSVFEQIFRAKNILPDDASQVNNMPDVCMPKVVGLPLSQACTKLKIDGLFYDVDGEGDYVIAQLPLPNTQLYKGETVVLVTN